MSFRNRAKACQSPSGQKATLCELPHRESLAVTIIAFLPMSHASHQLYVLHCSRGTRTDAFPGRFRNRSEALQAALNLLKCPNWTHDMWLRLDEPNGQSFGTDEIRQILGILRHGLPPGLLER